MASTSKPVKRQALMVALPPAFPEKKTKNVGDDKCVVCDESFSTSSNRLFVPNQTTWNNLASKAREWKDLGTDFDEIYTKIEVGSVPMKIHKGCKLDLEGARLNRAKENKIKIIMESNKENINQGHAPESNALRVKSCRTGNGNSLCVICNQVLEGKTTRNKFGGRTNVKSHRLETHDAWKTFTQAVQHVQDQFTKNRLQALVTFCENEGGIMKAAAIGVYYHKDCWKSFCRPVYDERERKGEEAKPTGFNWIAQIQEVAFDKLCEFVTDRLDTRKEVYTLRDLLCEYEQIQRDLSLTDEQIRATCNDKSALKSLKKKLEDRFGNEIGFKPRFRRNESSIVFFPKHGGSYVESSLNYWTHDTTSVINNFAKFLHGKHKKVSGLPWPCNVEELENDDTPNDIHNLIAFLADPNSELKEGRAIVQERLQPAVRFFSEGIMHLITGKRQPLQVSLSMAVHNLTGSKELINILKKMRIGVSYRDVIDELSALALNQHIKGDMNQLGSNGVICPSNIASGQPGTVVMDNDDFREDGLTGSETSHYTNIIMAQPESSNFKLDTYKHANRKLVIPSPEVRKSLSCPVVDKALIYKSRRPELKAKVMQTREEIPPVHRLISHALLRLTTSKENVPSYTGYHCNLVSSVEKWETFNVKSYSQPPCKEVVKDVLDWCQKVAEVKEMPVIQLVGDQAVYKYIEEFLCEDENKWPQVKGVLGGFHTELSYLNALGKKMTGSGIEELAVVAGLTAPGSIKQALSGKHYNRAMRLHKLVAEALLQILIVRCTEDQDILDSLKQDYVTTEEESEEFANSRVFLSFVEMMFEMISKSESDMAKFWLSYIIDVEVLYQHYHCLRSGKSFPEYISSCFNMLPLLAAYGNVNYLRYLTLYCWRMSTLTEQEYQNMGSIYSFSLTGRSYSKLSPDQVIEMTMNKQSKNRRSGGWVGFTKNLCMIAISILSRPSILYLREQLKKSVNIKKQVHNHPECGPSRIRKDLKVIEGIKLALEEWGADPWDLSKPTLRSLCSGQPVSPDVVKSLLTAHEEGITMAEEVLERLVSGSHSLHDPITKRKSKTFRTSTASDHKGKQELRTLADHASIKQIVEFLTSGDKPTWTLQDIMEYRLTKFSLSLFTADGVFHKPMKSKFFTLMNLQPASAPQHYHAVVDIGMAWNKITPANTWGFFAKCLYDFIANRHPQAQAFHIINDIYDEEYLRDSTKYYEQKRRMQGYGYVPNVYPAVDDLVPTGNSWRSFLSKPENKIRLQRFLLNQWKTYNHSVEWYFTINLLCYDLSSGDCNPAFTAPRPSEADTRAFFHAAQITDFQPLVFDFEDTDVWVIASYLSHTLDKDTFMFRKKSGMNEEFFHCRTLFSDPEVAKAAVGVYTFTGCDTVEGFFGLGKVTTMKRVLQEKNHTHLQTMQKLGEEKHLKEELFSQLLLFTIRVMYNDPVSNRLCDARARKWQQLRCFDTSRLPPDEDSFKQHCLRSHLQAYEYRHASQAACLSPTHFGWERVDDRLQPVLHTVPELPRHVNLPPPTVNDLDDTLNVDEEDIFITSDHEDSSLDGSDSDDEV